MTPLHWIGLAVAGVIGWAVLRRRDAAPATPSIKSKALLIGDSLAVGLGPPLTKALAPVKLWFVANVGTTAKDWTTGKYASGLDEALATIKPEVVLISLGTNDTAPGANIAGLNSRFSDLAETIRMSGAMPVFFLPPELPWARAPISDAIKAAGAIMIMPSAGLEHAPDKIHLTPKGYADWASGVAKQLKVGVVEGMPSLVP